MGYNEERLLTKCCVKKRCGSEYVKHGIVYQRRSWKNFTIQCQGELQILLKQTEVKRNTDCMMLAYKYAVVFSLECI